MVELQHGMVYCMDFRGQPEIRIWRVGVVGNRTRYQSGMYNYVHAKWTEVNLSGTALMNISVSGRKA